MEIYRRKKANPVLGEMVYVMSFEMCLGLPLVVEEVGKEVFITILKGKRIIQDLGIRGIQT